jgi:hypothetical protein
MEVSNKLHVPTIWLTKRNTRCPVYNGRRGRPPGRSWRLAKDVFCNWWQSKSGLWHSATTTNRKQPKHVRPGIGTSMWGVSVHATRRSTEYALRHVVCHCWCREQYLADLVMKCKVRCMINRLSIWWYIRRWWHVYRWWYPNTINGKDKHSFVTESNIFNLGAQSRMILKWILKKENGGCGEGLRNVFVVKDTNCTDNFDQSSGYQHTETAFNNNNNNNNNNNVDIFS